MSLELAQGEERQYLRHVSSRGKTGLGGGTAESARMTEGDISVSFLTVHRPATMMMGGLLK